MIIIAGYELVEVGNRDQLVEAHRDLVPRAREFDGCVHVAITADSADPARINSVEVWRDAGALTRGGSKLTLRTRASQPVRALERLHALTAGSAGAGLGSAP